MLSLNLQKISGVRMLAIRMIYGFKDYLADIDITVIPLLSAGMTNATSVARSCLRIIINIIKINKIMVDFNTKGDCQSSVEHILCTETITKNSKGDMGR